MCTCIQVLQGQCGSVPIAVLGFNLHNSMLKWCRVYYFIGSLIQFARLLTWKNKPRSTHAVYSLDIIYTKLLLMMNISLLTLILNVKAALLGTSFVLMTLLQKTCTDFETLLGCVKIVGHELLNTTCFTTANSSPLWPTSELWQRACEKSPAVGIAQILHSLPQNLTMVSLQLPRTVRRAIYKHLQCCFCIY